MALFIKHKKCYYVYMINSIKKYLLLIIIICVSVDVYAIENNQDMFYITKPSVVHVDVSVKGDIGVPNFIFDLDTFTFSTTTKVNGFSTSTIDKKVKGNGFIVSDDGIILTNSSLLVGVTNDFYRNVTEKYLQSINKNNKDSDYYKAYEKIFDYLIENSFFDADYGVKILNSKDVKYDATVLYSNSSYKDDNGLGLLKIEANDLPSVDVSYKKLDFGQSIYTIGYLLSENIPLEIVFNEGVISSVKNNQYKTDIILSKDLIGSPVFDKNNEAIGLLDSSGNILSLSDLEQILISKNIKIKTSLYKQYFLSGLDFMQNSSCKKAIEEFKKIEKINIDSSTEKYIKDKIESCNSMILSGLSVDTFLQKVIFLFKNNISNSYLWLSLFVVFILILLMFKSFIKRFRRDEGVIKKILNEDIVDIKKGDTDKKDLILESEKKDGFEIKPFENVEKEIIKTPTSKLNFKPLEKVEVVPKQEGPHAPVTPPNAIQPEQPTIVIAPFKTLSKPIRSPSSDTVEMKKDIRTDLPPRKKEDIL